MTGLKNFKTRLKTENQKKYMDEKKKYNLKSQN